MRRGAQRAGVQSGEVAARKRSAAGRRPPRAQLDQAAIVEAAVRLADVEGEGALVMRRVAAEIGAGTMSLYRHVAGKDGLLDLALEHAWSEIELPPRPSGDWRRDLAALARETRSMLRRHPWAAALAVARPPLGPGYLRWFEFSLAALGGCGLAPVQSIAVIGTLNAYVAGVAAYEAGDARARSRHGLDDEQMRALARPALEPLLASGRFPHLARIVNEGALAQGADAADEGFEFGLECVLNGLAQALPALRRRSGGPGKPVLTRSRRQRP